MFWEEEMVMRDVTNTGLVVSDIIGREVATQLGLEEALEASRYASHAYSAHSREWTPCNELKDTWVLPSVMERFNAADGEGVAVCRFFPELRWAWKSVGSNSLSLTSPTTSMAQLGAFIHSNQAKYFDLLAWSYVLKHQHVLATHVLLRLGERHAADGSNLPTLEERLTASFILTNFIPESVFS